MSNTPPLTKVDIYNTPIARKYRRSNIRTGIGPATPIPKPPDRFDQIEAIHKRDAEDTYLYKRLKDGYSVRAAAISASDHFGYKISENTVHGRIKTWRIAQARKIKQKCGE